MAQNINNEQDAKMHLLDKLNVGVVMPSTFRYVKKSAKNYTRCKNI